MSCKNQKPFWPFPLSPWLAASLKPSQCMAGYHPEQLQHTCDQPNTKLWVKSFLHFDQHSLQSQTLMVRPQILSCPYTAASLNLYSYHSKSHFLTLCLMLFGNTDLFLPNTTYYNFILLHNLEPTVQECWWFMISATYCQNVQFLGYFSFCCPFLTNPQLWINPPKCPSAPNNQTTQHGWIKGHHQSRTLVPPQGHGLQAQLGSWHYYDVIVHDPGQIYVHMPRD